jgi:hypothetical protein
MERLKTTIELLDAVRKNTGLLILLKRSPKTLQNEQQPDYVFPQ